MTATKQQQEQIEEFLAQGGKVDQIPQGRSGYVEGQSRSAWGAPRKRAATEPVLAVVAKKVKKTAKK